MLSGFSFRPTEKWQRFSRRFKIKGYTNFYSIWILPGAGAQDQFALSGQLPLHPGRRSGKNAGGVRGHLRQGRIALSHRENRFAMTFRAALDAKEETLTGRAEILFFHDRKQVASLPVTLTRQPDGIFEGQVRWNPSLRGAFAAQLKLAGRSPERIGGDFVVIHEPVLHPRFSPGVGDRLEYGERHRPLHARSTPDQDHRPRWRFREDLPRPCGFPASRSAGSGDTGERPSRRRGSSAAHRSMIPFRC